MFRTIFTYQQFITFEHKKIYTKNYNCSTSNTGLLLEKLRQHIIHPLHKMAQKLTKYIR